MTDEEIIYALKYPDYHTWRDTNDIRSGYWKDGTPVRLNDPELQPMIDKLMQRVTDDPEFAKQWLLDRGFTDRPHDE